MDWLPVVILVLIAVGITVSMLRGGRFGMSWYLGGRSWADRDREGRPVEPTGNVRSPQWGGTKIDE